MQELYHGSNVLVRTPEIRKSSHKLDFVIAKRTDPNFTFDYDVVKGAVANDRVFASLNAFEAGFMDKATLLAELRTWVYVDQILFHTQKSLDLLTFQKEIRV